MRRTLLVLAVSVLLLFLAAESRAAGLLRPRDGSPPIGVKSHRVTAVVTDGLARTTLRQTFVNPGDRMLEAIYSFPLPEGAALIDVAMEVGGQRLEGLLVERQRARRIYDSIVRRKKDPALVEQTGRNQFRLSVFPVMPRADTVVELTWIQRVPLSQGVFRYVYPLFLAKGDAKTEEDFTFLLTVKSSAPLTAVTSPMEDMDVVRKAPGHAIASFERMGSPLDRDVVVEAKVETDLPTLSVNTFRREGEDGYFMAVVTPPIARTDELIARDVILVIDTSGSMGGVKIVQAKAAAQYLLKNLRPADRVNVIRFSSDVQAFAEAPLPATPDALAELAKFVGDFHSGGGTALGDALKTAVAVKPEPGRVRTVVLLTDGRPTVGEKAPEKIVGFAREGGALGLRVFTFGVGADVRPSLLEGIAAASRGQAEVFSPAAEIESRLRRFLDRAASPVLADLKLTVEGLNPYDLYPRPIPDAYLGEQVVILGRYREGGEHAVKVNAVLGKREAVLSEAADFRKTPGGSEAVMHLFAREKLDYLESVLRLRSGLDDAAYYASLDRGAYSTKDEIVDEIVNLSLATGVQSAYSSFLVLLPEDRRRVDPRDLAELNAALERARLARANAAGVEEGAVAADLGDDAEHAREAEEEAQARRKASVDRSVPFFGGSEGGTARAVPSFGGSGAYRGPQGEVPPGHRDPTDTQPSPEQPGTPPPPPPSGGATAPPAAGPGGIATPGGRRRAAPPAMTFESWIFWWGYNRGEILSRIPADRSRTLISPEVVRSRIVPALDRLLDSPADLHPAIRTQAALARARAGGGPDLATRIMKMATGQASDRLAQEAAILSLVILGEKTDAVRDYLLDIAADPGAPPRPRGFALVALGLLDFEDEKSRKAILDRVTSQEMHTDVPICALLAAGLSRDEWFVPSLIEMLTTGRAGTRKLTDHQRAWVVDALGRIGDPSGLSAVAAQLRKEGLHTTRSAAIALGRIDPGRGADLCGEFARMLIRFHAGESDLTAKNFALISLGRIAGAEGADEKVRRKIVGYLKEVYVQGDKVKERPFAALAMGLAGAHLAEVDETKRELAGILHRDLSKQKGDKVALGANAIALGLLRHRPAVKLLIQILTDRGLEKKLRGAAAVALGMIGDNRADAEVIKALREREDRDLRIDTAIAAGLLCSPGAVEPLVAVLKHRKSSQFVLGSVSLALGRVGDASAIAPLSAITEPGVANGMYPDLTRALAAAALGRCAWGPREGPFSRISNDLNYRAMCPVLDTLLTIE